SGSPSPVTSSPRTEARLRCRAAPGRARRSRCDCRSRPRRRRSGMPRILVVDDDRETCRFMDELLQAPGREIELARTPQEAMALAQRGGFDLVVSDINLNADLHGLDLLRAFKRADPQLEVVLISGFGTLQTAIEAVRAGAFDYVSKPFDIAEVKETVGRALKRR